MIKQSDFTIPALGECTIPSPIRRGGFVEEGAGVLYHSDPLELKPLLDKKLGLQIIWHIYPHKIHRA